MEDAPLTQDPSTTNGGCGEAMLFDVFICHASEDKDAIVRPLAEALSNENLVVWYDEFELKPGDSLRESIDRGLAKSRHGVVVLSHAFFQKRWPARELNGLVARQMRGDEMVLIPLWHGVTRDDVVEFSPPLGDLIAVKTSRGVASVCREIARTIRPQESPLIVARDELIAFGMTPPVISDEWWLDVVEASNRIAAGGVVIPDCSHWGRWTFPLPGEGARGEDRGIRLAWTAMQLDWEQEAQARKITQITEPSTVLEFIDQMPGLGEVCHNYPRWLAVYAPQLTIPGLGAEFERRFDELFATGVAHDELILRNPDLRDVDAARAACQFVQGPLCGPSPRAYETFDYLVWLLSSDSQWLPEAHRELLCRGMREWAVWPSSYAGSKEGRLFLEWLLGVRPNSGGLHPPTVVLRALAMLIERSKSETGVQDSVEVLVDQFLRGGYIEAHVRQRLER